MNDVVIWNEPSSNDFWQPQFRGGASAAPAAYGALLATCWDTPHGLRPGVNLVSSTSSRGNDDAFAVSNAGHLAYCQPGVGAFFNFLLVDEPSLSAWQSGLFWADGYPKPAYDAFRAAIADVRADAVRCA